MKKRIRSSLLLLLASTVIVGCGKQASNEKVQVEEDKSETSILAEIPEVSHGLGYIDGHYVTNTIEAFEENYRRGFRVFEVDLIMTSDNRLIGRHDWTLGHYGWLGQEAPAVEEPLPFDTVMGLTIHGEYHAPSWEQILELMQKYPDVYFVTDTKDKDEANVRKSFSYIVNTTKEVDPSLLDRIIPQIYDQPMLGYINSYHVFNEVIYTLYHHTNENMPTPEELSKWCVENNVTAVAGLPFRLTAEMQSALKDSNIAMYTHTINNPEEAEAFRSNGIGVYTDYLLYDGEKFLTPSGVKQ